MKRSAEVLKWWSLCYHVASVCHYRRLWRCVLWLYCAS